MQTVQKRRERENRQINERLKTLIAAYKTLGGSFTGDLAVDPAHRRDLRSKAEADGGAGAVREAGEPLMAVSTGAGSTPADPPGAERCRRVRDAVEAALSDVVLLGTEEQVELAVAAANDLVAGRPVETAEIVVSLRIFIRDVLDLDPVSPALVVPRQGPLRTGAGGARGGADGASGRGGGGTRGGGGGGGGGGGAGGGGGMAVGTFDTDGHPH